MVGQYSRTCGKERRELGLSWAEYYIYARKRNESKMKPIEEVLDEHEDLWSLTG